MKKIKLLAPLVGSLTALTAIIPAVSCAFNDEAKKYEVTITKGFTLVNTEPVESGYGFQSDIKWNDSEKIINVSTVKVMVGNRILIRNEDFTYNNSRTKAKVGTIKINDGLINGNVSIEVSLISKNQAPITLENIGLRDVAISSETKDVTVDTELSMIISWDEATTTENKYFSNLITIYIGGNRIYGRTETDPNGFYYQFTSESSIKLTVPKENIKDNSEIIILVDIEKSEYDNIVLLNNADTHYVIYQEETYFDALHSQGVKGQPSTYLHIAANKTIEFAIDLNLWDDEAWLNPLSDKSQLDFAIGAWDWQYNVRHLQYEWRMSGFDLTTGTVGKVYYGQTELEVAEDAATTTFPAYLLKLPEGSTWGSKGSRQWITGWYTFSEDHTAENVQFLLGLPSNQN